MDTVVESVTLTPAATARILKKSVTGAIAAVFAVDPADHALAGGVGKIRSHFGTRLPTVIAEAVVLHAEHVASGRGMRPIEAICLFFDELHPLTIELMVKRLERLVYAEVIAAYMAETGEDPFTCEAVAA